MTSDAKYVLKILRENEALRLSNGYLQSALNVYNKWFLKLNVKEEIYKYQSVDYDFMRDSVTTRIYKTIRFPDIRLVEDFDNSMFQLLDKISDQTFQCDVCQNGTKSLELQGERLSFCFRCGRALL